MKKRKRKLSLQEILFLSEERERGRMRQTKKRLVRLLASISISVVFIMFCRGAWPFACAQSSTGSFSVDDVLSILRSKDSMELSNVYLRSDKTYVSTVAHAYRAYSLKTSGSEEQLFVVLPESTTQIRQLYDLTVANPTTGRKLLVELYQEYYKMVYAIAPRHPDSFHRLFGIACNFGKGMYEGEQDFFCGLLHDLYQKAPREYLHALADETTYRRVGLLCAAQQTNIK